MTLEFAYAVEPTMIRDELRLEGLLPRLDHNEDELYLFDTRERAERFAASGLELFLSTPDGRVDVWEARVAGLPVRLIDNDDGPSALVRGVVAPADMRLVHTIQ